MKNIPKNIPNGINNLRGQIGFEGGQKNSSRQSSAILLKTLSHKWLRIALGAQRGEVMWLVLRQASWMLLTGSVVGLILAYLSSLLLRTFLYGVKPHDPWTMGAGTLLLLGGGLAAAYLPARRAASVDPMQALRTE